MTERSNVDGAAPATPATPATPVVAVCIVTHNDAADLPACLEAVIALTHRPLELVFVDCASADGSLDLARSLTDAMDVAGVTASVVDARGNRGFAGGMNLALQHSSAPFVLTLNADARPAPRYVSRLLDHLTPTAARVGAATGRLCRLDDPRRLDACGMRLARGWRHLDRASGQLDEGQLNRAERVFGATGAASLFTRAALDDVRFEDGTIFDEDFHSFREDAELCFRLQERGWDVVYEPAAQAGHRRRVLPTRRSALPAAVNYHSLKNRYLLRAYHQTPRDAVRSLVPTALRDVLALGYVLLRERSSLAAYRWLWHHRKRIRARRRHVQGRRTRPAAVVDRWFRVASLPLEYELATDSDGE